jgi:transposase-like protein
METGRKRKYDAEFKREAVRLSLEKGNTARSVERDLGLWQGAVSYWRREFEKDPEQAFPGKGNLKARDAEVSDLHKELERVTRERDILKKAVAIFSKEPNRYTDS